MNPCPAETVFCLLEHGANANDLMRGIEAYICEKHKQECALPVIEHRLQNRSQQPRAAIARPVHSESGRAQANAAANGNHPEKPREEQEAIQKTLRFAISKLADPAPVFTLVAETLPFAASDPSDPLSCCITSLIDWRFNYPWWKRSDKRSYATLELMLTRYASEPDFTQLVAAQYCRITFPEGDADRIAQFRTLQRLLERTRVHPDTIWTPSWTALTWEVQALCRRTNVCGRRGLAILKLLLRHGADPLLGGGDVDPLTGRQESPLGWAINRRKMEVVKVC